MHRHKLRALTFGILCCLLSACTPEIEPRAKPANLLLIVVDSLRRDHLSGYGHPRQTSPRLDAFAEDAILFENAYSTAPWTQPSIASMLTSLHPLSHGVTHIRQRLPDDAHTLAEVLSDEAYATAGVVSHRLIGEKYNFQQGFQSFVEIPSKDSTNVTSQQVASHAIAAVERLSAGPDPFFLFVHFFDPHFAYMPHREYSFAPERVGRLRGGEFIGALRLLDPPPSAEELEFIGDLYDEEIRHTDFWVGEVLRDLRERGLYDDTLIVFTADHGEEFYERAWIGHTRTLYEELIHVPLVIRPPRRSETGARSHSVSLVDLAPTILDLLDLPWKRPSFQGASFRGVVEGAADQPPRAIHADVSFPTPNKDPRLSKRAQKSALIQWPHKLIHDRDRDAYELYDLGTDPLEQTNLVDRLPQIVAKMRAQMTHARGEAAAASISVEGPTLSEDERRKLETLGYLSP